MRRLRVRHLALLAGALLLPLAAAACSDDDDAGASDTTAGTTTEESDTSDEAEDELAAACDTWIEADIAVSGLMSTGEGDPAEASASMQTALDASDPAMTDTLASLIEATEAQMQDPEGEESEETSALYAEMVDWAGASCDVERIEVLAVDFGFEGLPENLPTGYTVVDFHNHGVENHEIIVARKNDGVTETAEELLALPEEEAMEKVTMIGFGFAQSEGAATISWNLDEPGDYFALCFLPVGSVGEAQGEGPPHFTQGMLQEFTVS